MNKKYGIFIIVIVFLTILGIIFALFYGNLKSNKSLEVEATVKMIGNNYIIAEDDNGEEYSLTTNETYHIGDRVDFLIKNIRKKDECIEGTLVKISTISQDISFSITDDTQNEEESDETNNSANNVDDTEKNIDNKPDNETDTVAYFTALDNQLDAYEQNKSLEKSLKENFITVVDFLFYNGTIKGKTFAELSTSAKIRILQVTFSIDEKIDKHFPGYKETISTTSKKIYTNIKVKVLELYLEITTTACKDKQDICNLAKDGLRDLKANFSLTWDLIKEATSTGFIKLKDWYEIWKEL